MTANGMNLATTWLVYALSLRLLATLVLARTVSALLEIHRLTAIRMALVIVLVVALGCLILTSLVRRRAHIGMPPPRRRPNRPSLLSFCSVALAGIWLGPLAVGGPMPPAYSATLQGTVVEVRPERGYVLDGVEVLGAPELELPGPLVVSAAAFDPPMVGVAVSVEVEVSYPRTPSNPSAVPSSPPRPFAVATSEAAPSGSAPWSIAAANALRERLSFEDSPVATTLYRALLLGDRSALPPSTRFAYQDTGTAHLLAISGMNLALLGLSLFWLFRWSLLSMPWTRRVAQGRRVTPIAATLAILAILAYSKLIAPSDATDRALVAFVLVLSGQILMRRAPGLHTVMMCVLVLLVLEPEVALRPGFQLSVAATTALILVAPTARALGARVATSPLPTALKKPLAWLVVFLAANLATSLATLPLGLAWFGQLPLAGLWVNLFAIPFMGLVVFPAGVIWAVLATLSPDLGDALSPVLVWLGEAFNQLIVSAGEIVGPSTTRAWPLWLAALSTLAMLLSLVSRRRVLGAALLATSTLVMLGLDQRPRRLELHMLDVGHGDALAMRLPDGQRVLVDTAGALRPDANRQVADRVVLPALLALGFERVDLMVLTHGDLDHAGAAPLLLERIETKELWVPPCALRVPAVAAAAARVEALGGKARVVARGPPMAWGGAELELLWPPADIESEDGCAFRDNDTSLVLRVGFAGRRVLLTGDIEARAEEALLAEDHRRDLPQLRAGDLIADVLKSPHHGSKTSSTDALLDAVSPRFALVSGLPGRLPMPPHERVLRRYDDRRIETWVTGDVGALRVAVEPDGTLSVGPAAGP